MYTKNVVGVIKPNYRFMETQIKIPATFDDVVFANRNKLYGAYALRKSYNSNLLKALSISALILLSLVFLSTRQWSDKVITPAVLSETILNDVLTEDPYEVKQETPDEKPAETPPQQTTTAPVATTTPTEFSPEGTTEPQIKPVTTLVTNFAQTGSNIPTSIILPAGTGGTVGSVGTTASAGTTGTNTGEIDPVIFAEEAPEFPGGEAAMNKFLVKFLQKEDQWRDMGLTGKVYMQFVVDAEGNVTRVKALAGPSETLKKISERAILAMPKWKPGRNGKHNVPVILTIPINFLIG